MLAEAGPLSSAESPSAPGPLNATSGSGPTRRPRAGSCATTPSQAPTSSPRTGFVLADDTSPVYLAGIFQGAPAVFGHDPENRGRLPHRAGSGLARARTGTVRGHRAVLPLGVSRNLVSEWIPPWRGWRPSCRPAAPSPMSAADTAPRPSCSPRPSRTRRSWATTTTRRRSTPPAQRAADAGLRRSGAVRCRRRRRLSRRLRRRRHLRRSPRHGRPARGRAPRARVADSGRHVHAVRAGGRATRSATTSTRSAGCTTRSPRWSAHRLRWPSPGARLSGPRPDRLDSVRSTEAGVHPRCARPPVTPFNIVLEGRPYREADRPRTTGCPAASSGPWCRLIVISGSETMSDDKGPLRSNRSTEGAHRSVPRGGQAVRDTSKAPVPPSPCSSRSTDTVSPSRTSPPSRALASWSPMADCTSRRSGRAP